MTRLLLSLALGLLPLGFAVVLTRRLGRGIPVDYRRLAMVCAAGFAMGSGAVYFERLAFGLTGLALDVSTAGTAGALLAMFLFVAPFEEGLKVLLVWPLYRRGRLDSRRLGIIFGATGAAGFASAESVATVFVAGSSGVDLVRLAVAAPAHLFCAGVWGYALGSQTRGRWFSGAWLAAMLTHGVYDHIVFGRGAGLLAAAVPLLGAMAFLGWIAMRDVAPRQRLSDGGPPSSAILSSLPEPPSLRAMQRALRKTDRPLMLHWIAVGALVNVGVVLVSLALAVYAGHRMGVDFALADEADVRSIGPLILLGSGLLAAFPFAGYLVARASAAQSVLEPAMAAALAIAAVVLALSATAPVVLIFALAVSPVAFGLACSGAWFGMER